MALETLNTSSERNWLEAYLTGELSEAQIAEFETYCLLRPDLLSHIDADTGLRVAFAVSRHTTKEARRVVPHAVSAKPPIHGAPSRTNSRALWTSGIAASFVVGMISGWLVNSKVPLSVQGIDGDLARVVIETDRGESTVRVSGRRDARLVLMDFGIPEQATSIRVTFGNGSAIALTATDGFAPVVMTRQQFDLLRSATLSYDLNGEHRERTIDIR